MLRISEYIRDTLAGKPARPFPGVILIWNLTRGCNLTCKHCYAAAGRPDPRELTSREALELIPSLRRAGVLYAILSGGEPLARRDVFELASALRAQGIATSLSTNGLLITERNLPRIRESFDYVGISIDGTEGVHDQFRGMQGAYLRSLQALRHCRAAGMRVGLRFTLSAMTAPSLPYILELTEQEGFPKLYVSHLVFSGRGGSLGAVPPREHRRLSQMLVEQALDWQAAGRGPDVVTGNNETDAVVLLERFRERYPEHAPRLLERLQTWGGNQAGVRLVNLDAVGNVKPDPFYADPVGNVRDLPFEDIWREGELLRQLRCRPYNLKGACSECAYLPICNGNSRARSHALTGDYFEADPCCFLSA